MILATGPVLSIEVPRAIGADSTPRRESPPAIRSSRYSMRLVGGFVVHMARPRALV